MFLQSAGLGGNGTLGSFPEQVELSITVTQHCIVGARMADIWYCDIWDYANNRQKCDNGPRPPGGFVKANETGIPGLRGDTGRVPPPRPSGKDGSSGPVDISKQYCTGLNRANVSNVVCFVRTNFHVLSWFSKSKDTHTSYFPKLCEQEYSHSLKVLSTITNTIALVGKNSWSKLTFSASQIQQPLLPATERHRVGHPKSSNNAS